MTSTTVPAGSRILPAAAVSPTGGIQWTGPADRGAAEAAVRTLYANADMPMPQMAWTPSPIALARAWKVHRQTEGEGVRGAVFDAPVHRLLGQLRRTEAVRPAAARTALADLTGLLAHEGQKARVGAVARLQMLGRLLVTLTRRATWQSFRAVGISPYDHAWLLSENLSPGFAAEEGKLYAALATLVANCGWMVPCERVCWISERPVTLALDDRGRLHCKDGPALAYADGWRRYAWKGIEVPSAYIQHPERITLNAIDSQTDIFVRRCLIEMVTPKRFIRMGGADLVMHDETGTLWRRTWPRGDGWAAVEVVNGTPGPDGQVERYVLQVPPELESARAAVAWTYGMTEQQYRSLVLRT